MSKTQAGIRRQRKTLKKDGRSPAPAVKGRSTLERLARRSAAGSGQFTGTSTATKRSKLSGRAERALAAQASKRKQGGGM